MTKIQLKAKFAKMNSKVILLKALDQKLTPTEARVAAEVIERRFPTPQTLITPQVSRPAKMTKTQIKAKIKKMSTPAMFRKAIRGYMPAMEGKILAKILSLRIPSPTAQAN
jgi:hypothetical protein